VDRVNRLDAGTYCLQLSVQEAAAGRLPSGYVYRLPTEAEWEYCCRAGTTTEWNVGTSLNCIQANFYDISGTSCGIYNQSTAVGSYAANAWGLHDMHGNAWEWTLDNWDGVSGYPAGPVTDPFVGGTPIGYGIRRGGSSGSVDTECRSAYRYRYFYVGTDPYLGFRVVCAPVLP
jgi:formylglycine-generating enzyme required for sulfatase activity